MSHQLETPRIVLKLRHIFEAFAENRLPKDDTLLEKFNSLLQMWLSESEDVKAFLEEVSFVKLMEHAIKETSLEPSTLAFFLKLASYVPPTVQDSKIQEMTHYLYKRVISEQCLNPCILNAWLQGLSIMICDDNLAKDWILTEDFEIKIISCLQHPGLFIIKSAVELLSSLIVVDLMQQEQFPDRMKLRNAFCEFWDRQRVDKDVRSTCLQVLLQSAVKASHQNVDRFTTDYGVFDKLFAILESCDDSHHSDRNQAMLLLMECRCCIGNDEVSRLESLVLSLLQSGSIQTAIMLAQWLLFNCEGKIKNPSVIRWAEFFILDLAVNPTKHVLDGFEKNSDMIEQCLVKQKHRFPSLFLRQLDLLVNYSKHKTLPLEVLELLLTVLENICSDQCLDNSFLFTLYQKLQKIYLAIINTFSLVFQTQASHYRKQMCSFVLICAKHLKHTQSSVVVHKTLQVMAASLVHGLNAYTDTEKYVWDRVNIMLQYLFCQPNWEILDSVTEFVTDLLQIKEDKIISPIMDSVLSSIIQLTDHSESYLRASAISCLGAMFNCHSAWSSITDTQSPDVLLDKVLFAMKDQEAFPRRAAVKVIRYAYDLECFESRTPEMLSAIHKMTSDLDWEVKSSCLDFWLVYVESLQCNGLTDTDQMERLVSSGCAEALLSAAHDYDKKVQKKACQLLSTIRGSYDTEVFKPDTEEQRDNDSETDIRRLSGSTNCPGLMNEIWSLNLTALTEISNQSTDQYARNTEALLDDILMSVHAVSSSDIGEEEDNVLDCY